MENEKEVKMVMNTNNETGRSMVEMLGVLAIVGVLSVGGIAGYTSAMRSYRANEIVNATSMLYMLGIAQNAGAGDAQMVYSTHFGANAVPSGADEITYNANKTITLAITDADICNQVKVKLGDKADGTCATSGTSTLTVTLGDASEVSEENYDCHDPNGKENDIICVPSQYSALYYQQNKCVSKQWTYFNMFFYTDDKCTILSDID